MGHGNEREAGAYGKEKSEASGSLRTCYSFERATGDEASPAQRYLGGVVERLGR